MTWQLKTMLVSFVAVVAVGCSTSDSSPRHRSRDHALRTSKAVARPDVIRFLVAADRLRSGMYEAAVGSGACSDTTRVVLDDLMVARDYLRDDRSGGADTQRKGRIAPFALAVSRLASDDNCGFRRAPLPTNKIAAAIAASDVKYLGSMDPTTALRKAAIRHQLDDIQLNLVTCLDGGNIGNEAFDTGLAEANAIDRQLKLSGKASVAAALRAACDAGSVDAFNRVVIPMYVSSLAYRRR